MSVFLEGKEVVLPTKEEEMTPEEVTDFEIVNNLPSEEPPVKAGY